MSTQWLPAMVVIVMAIVFSSCSNTKYLNEGTSLYTGYKIHIQQGAKVRQHKKIKKIIESTIRPEPNRKLFGLRAKLWFYNLAGKKKADKGFRHFVKYKLGEPPVLFEQKIVEKNHKAIQSELFNHGFFDSFVKEHAVTKGKKTKVIYDLFLYEPYRIDSILLPTGSNELYSTIRETSENTLLESKDFYDLDKIKLEKERIDAYLKTKGFYYFNKDYLIYDADTVFRDRKVNLHLKVRDETPYEALLVYRINDVFVNTSYTLGKDSVQMEPDTINEHPFYYYSTNHEFKRKVVMRSVFLNKGEIYSRINHNATLGQLMGMGTFKFVNVRFAENDTILQGFMDARINLTPLPKWTSRIELEAVSKSNNYVGPGIRASLRNRNAFRGAEWLVFDLHGSFETQLGKNAKGFNSYEIGPSVTLTIPRFVVPFRLGNPKGYYIPKTNISLSYDYLVRTGFFNLTSLNFVYGYKWKESKTKDHQLDLLNINFIRISHKSEEFQNLLDSNLLLQQSFEEQFIEGLQYKYTYNEQVIPDRKNQFYFGGQLEFAGNTLSMLQRAALKRTADPEHPFSLAGSPYAQFSRTELDVRDYYNFDERNQLVARVYAGVGIAYGNSATLPFIRQFFSGGSSSIRAFRARSVGPGTWLNENKLSTFYDQGGDVKLEGNIEYRFKIAGLFRGAFFTDAGNIWLIKDNPDVPGGKFSGSFMNELAVGGGMGLRLDANFFVLRLDLAIPFRKPWLPDQNRWILKDIKPGSSTWRRENLLLNIAIGYPF